MKAATEVRWMDLEQRQREEITARLVGLIPGQDPEVWWDLMPPETQRDWLWHDAHPTEDTWSAGIEALSRQADEATADEFAAITACLELPHGGGSHVMFPPVKAAMSNDAPPLHEEWAGRRLRLTPASAIVLKPVRWLWDQRIPMGSLSLLAGREGIGKSTLAYWLAAQVTRGELAGCCEDNPRAVIVVATEDSWAHTIVPRLIGAGANLELVFRADVVEGSDVDGAMSLPEDLEELEKNAEAVKAALILLDPLTSRLGHQLDTHKDADVRRALEPLTAIADRVGASVLGIIHVNKSGGGDALNAVMGSRAFTAVARSVLFALKSPEDEDEKYLGLTKSNLGRSDLPTLKYRIVTEKVADTPDGDVFTGKVEWTGETDQSISEALSAVNDGPSKQTAVDRAARWLEDHLGAHGGSAPSDEVKLAGKEAGHSDRTLKRAKVQLGVDVKSIGYPRKTHWVLKSEVGPSGERAAVGPSTDGGPPAELEKPS